MQPPTKRRRVDPTTSTRTASATVVTPLPRVLVYLVGDYLDNVREVLQLLCAHDMALVSTPDDDDGKAQRGTQRQHPDTMRWLECVWSVNRIRERLSMLLGASKVDEFCRRIQRDGVLVAGSFVLGTLLGNHGDATTPPWVVGDMDLYVLSSRFLKDPLPPPPTSMDDPITHVAMYETDSVLDMLWEACGKSNEHWDVHRREEYEQLKATGLRGTRSYWIPPAVPSCPNVELNMRKRFHVNIMVVDAKASQSSLADWIAGNFDFACLATQFTGDRVVFAALNECLSMVTQLQCKAPPARTITRETCTDLKVHGRCVKYMARGLTIANYDRAEPIHIPVECIKQEATVYGDAERYRVRVPSWINEPLRQWLNHPLFPPIVYYNVNGGRALQLKIPVSMSDDRLVPSGPLHEQLRGCRCICGDICLACWDEVPQRAAIVARAPFDWRRT